MSPVCRWVMSEPPCVPKRGDVVVVIAHLSHWLWTLVFELAASHAAPRVGWLLLWAAMSVPRAVSLSADGTSVWLGSVGSSAGAAHAKVAEQVTRGQAVSVGRGGELCIYTFTL